MNRTDVDAGGETNTLSEIERLFKKRTWTQKRWSFFHHVFAGGAAVLSLIVASLTAKAPFEIWGIKSQDSVWVIALLAGILSTVTVFGKFREKWMASRLTRSALEVLRLDAHSRNPDWDLIRQRLQNIIREHDLTVVNSEVGEEPSVKVGEHRTRDNERSL